MHSSNTLGADFINFYGEGDDGELVIDIRFWGMDEESMTRTDMGKICDKNKTFK